jgi:hypothetical protein
LGGLALVHFNPVLALLIFLIGIAAFLYFAPKILRAMKMKIWLAWKKINLPAYSEENASLPVTLPTNLASVFARENVLGETVAWAVRCVSGRGRRIPGNVFGVLAATNEEPRKLVFVTRKFARTIDLDNATVRREPGFLSENLIILPADGRGPKYSFIFPRSDARLVEQIVTRLHERVSYEPMAADSASSIG